MRIAYISLHWPRTISSGVGKKIHRQIETWKSFGHEVCLFMHLEDAPVSGLLSGKKFFYPSQSRLAASQLGRVRAAEVLLNAVKGYQPDIIYLRYGIYVYPIHKLAKIAPLVEELTTNDLVQHKGLGLIYSLYNRLTRGLLLKNTSGLVCLSDELKNAPYNAKFRKKTAIVGDSIDLDNIEPLPAPHNTEAHIAFIGSPGSLWQGVDKLLQLAQNFPDLHIHIIGYSQLGENRKLPKNLYLHGYLEKDEYTKILAAMDCAIGSLALHRIQLEESSPLKTRECLALGIPMVLPYKDTDLDSLDAEFLLRIPNREDNILTHGKLIHDFAYAMRGKRVNRALITPYIDSQHKEQKRLIFFEKILAQKKQI
ncbi:MAG: glycosyltransferase family 4 protein [Chloroflexi bacterium]|nr:glycosyltransferase family 4 protein [Chloroflexota bacterium]